MTASHAPPRLKLLTPREVTACKKLAGSELSDNKRAAALLAIHQGQTQARAAQASDLSLGQVKYIVNRFRQLGMQALADLPQNSDNAEETAVKTPVTGTKKKKDKAGKKAKKIKKAKNKDKKAKKKDKSDKKKTKNKNKNKK